MATNSDLAELKNHAEFLKQKMEEAREGIGETNVVIPDGNSFVQNPAMTGYIQLAKEYRLTVKQLDEMGELNKEEKKNALTEMRVLFNKKAM